MHSLLKPASVVLVCLILLTAPLVSNNEKKESKEIEGLTSQINELTADLESNLSHIANLTKTIAALNERAEELELAIDGKAAENRKLKRQVVDLSEAFGQLLDELECLERSEQINSLVARLRTPLNMPTEEP